MPADPLASLRARALAAAEHAHVPFSGAGAAVVLLLADGTWVPGVRVESATFSLTIPPALNAYTTAIAAGRGDVVAAAFSRPARRVERAFLDDLPEGPFRGGGEDATFVAAGVLAREASLPALRARLDPFLDALPLQTPADGVERARAEARRALVPASHFRVGCLLEVAGVLVPGVNVEPYDDDAAPGDWMHVLCAERSALGTACSYGLIGGASARAETPPGEARSLDEGDGAKTLYLSCPSDPAGSPCGACRQLLVELLPRGVLWMDRAPAPPERASPADLLPHSFRGATLPRSVPDA